MSDVEPNLEPFPSQLAVMQRCSCPWCGGVWRPVKRQHSDGSYLHWLQCTACEKGYLGIQG